MDDLVIAIKKTIWKRQKDDLINELLPNAIVVQFISNYKKINKLTNNFVSYIKCEKKEFTKVEKKSLPYLEKLNIVEYKELVNYLISQGEKRGTCYSEIRYSPLFTKKRDDNGNQFITLIGTDILGFQKTLSFDEIINYLVTISSTEDEFLKRLRVANDKGKNGERLLNSYFKKIKGKEISDFKWVSEKHPGAPCDFVIEDLNGIVSLIDVKTTTGDFDKEIYISFFELSMMKKCEQYLIYRVCQLENNRGKLYRSENMIEIANLIINWFDSVPVKVKPTGISFCPSILNFKDKIDHPILITDISNP